MKEKLRALIGDKDTKNVIWNMIMSFGIKGGSMFIALFTTSAYITYFSNDAVLGVWFTILSILAWMLNFDMGIGNGVRNKLVKTFGDGNIEESKRYISSAYITLSAVGIVLLVVGSIAVRFLPWNKILGISNTIIDYKTLITAIRIVFASILIQFVLRLITSITYALQRSFVSSLLNLCTNVILLLYVTAANYSGRNGSIVAMATVYMIAVNLPLVIATLIIFATKLKSMIPNVDFFSMRHAKDTLKLGGIFLYLQLVALLMNNTANFMISSLLGSDQVVEYQLYYKVFYLMTTIVAIAITPMWSAITKAMVEKRYQWLRKSLYFMLGLVVFIFVIQFALVPFLQIIFNIWLGNNTRNVNYITGVVFAIYGSLFTWQMICCYISNGLNKLKIQTIFLTVGVLISFTCSYILSRIWGHYLAITVGMILGFLPFCIVQTVWTLNYCKQLKKMSTEAPLK